MYHRYGFKAAIIPYTMATGVATSRVVNKRHQIRDVVVGALLAQGI